MLESLTSGVFDGEADRILLDFPAAVHSHPFRERLARRSDRLGFVIKPGSDLAGLEHQQTVPFALRDALGTGELVQRSLRSTDGLGALVSVELRFGGNSPDSFGTGF